MHEAFNLFSGSVREKMKNKHSQKIRMKAESNKDKFKKELAVEIFRLPIRTDCCISQ